MLFCTFHITRNIILWLFFLTECMQSIYSYHSENPFREFKFFLLSWIENHIRQWFCNVHKYFLAQPLQINLNIFQYKKVICALPCGNFTSLCQAIAQLLGLHLSYNLYNLIRFGVDKFWCVKNGTSRIHIRIMVCINWYRLKNIHLWHIRVKTWHSVWTEEKARADH